MYTAVPARGKLDWPPAILSLISPPEPVAAPLNGSTVVGKLCVSAFKEIEDFILNDRIEGAKNFKVNATPTIIINDKKFEKSLNYKNLKKSLEKLI